MRRLSSVCTARQANRRYQSDASGQVLGSVVIVRDLREELARAAIHHAIATSVDNAQLFATVAQQLRILFGFDELRVNAISQCRRHVRRLYSSDEHAADKFPYVWWPMPPFIQMTFADRTAGVVEVDTLRADPKYIALQETDIYLRNYLATNVRQILSLPVMQAGRTVAFFNLDSHHDGHYNAASVELLKRLPIAEVVTHALHRDEHRRQQVVYDLIRSLGGAADDVRRFALALVQALVQIFDWTHVSIFQHEEGTDCLRLLCQANGGGALLPSGLTLPCAGQPGPDGPRQQGAMAQAALSREVVNIGHTRSDGPCAVLPDFDASGSELAIPMLGHKTLWVLNIESRMLCAFADEEIDLLKLLAAEAGSVLRHSALLELQAAVLASINDAVIETNSDGRVRWTNVAARKMLGAKITADANIWMTDLVQDGAVHDAVCHAEKNCQHEMVLRTASGAAIPVLLSATTLPEHLGGRVYVASDLTFQKEVQRMSALKEVFQHAAMEGRIPLALAATWLRQVADTTPSLGAAIGKILRQLARADLPLERLLRLVAQETVTPPAQPDGLERSPWVTLRRLLRLSPPPQTLQASRSADLGEALQATLTELPESLMEAIHSAPVTGALRVGAEFNDLQFCVESLISFGLRTRPQAKALHVRAARDGNTVGLLVSGDWRPALADAGEHAASERWRRKSVGDLTLGESVIDRIVRQAGGSCRLEWTRGLSLHITFPACD
jgi:PAS domain-containing protein